MAKREKIVSAFVAALAGTTSVDNRVFRNRLDPMNQGELPAIVVRPLTDEAVQTTIPYLDWELTIEVAVVATGDVPDAVCDPILADINNRLVIDSNLTNLIKDLDLARVSWEFNSTDVLSCAAIATYIVKYRSTSTNLA